MKNQNIKANVRSKTRWGVVGIFALLAIAVIFDAPNAFNRGVDAVNRATHLGVPRVPEKPFSLGLDLQGGAHLVYQADVKNIAPSERATSVEGVRDVIERRVNGLGVGEPNVQTSKEGEDYRILVELPGVTDVKTAIAMIGETPILEFKEENTEPPRELTAEEKKQMDTFNADARKRADALLKRVQKGESFETIARESSEDTATKNNGGYLNYINRATPFGDELYTWAASAKPNDVSKTLISTTDGLNIVKRGAERAGQKEVTVSHILICYLGSAGCNAEYTKEEALKKAQDVYTQANAQNFAALAKEHSTDEQTKNDGGALPPFTKGIAVKAFEDAIFSAQAGQIIGPVETEYGYHIIYKQKEEDTKEYELWRILVKTQSATDIVPPASEWKTTGLSGKQLERTAVVTNPQTGAIEVSLQFNREGTDLFKDLTERNVGKPIAIFLDGTPISAPTVNQAIPNGQAVISGNFTLQEARLLSQRLNAGALPVPVELVAQQAVGATLGQNTLEKSLKAGIVAVLLVMLFMVLYYRFPGFLAVIALLVYVSVSLAIFKLMGVTLTLAGIAGFILSVGMAVDANILVFERMKEELRAGKSLKAAVEEGFLRAWTSIRDGNVVTLLTCAILIWFGSSFVKGFAVTLAVGILVSIFSAITVTRTLLRFVVPWFSEKANWMFLGSRSEKESVSSSR
ncbi:MAG TPA: protein translocase subunit SecD [Candidatus Kapabacteria bacterium]|nr:protein translocase subunit SecD [Candidatus Kapabacteria bacterium]